MQTTGTSNSYEAIGRPLYLILSTLSSSPVMQYYLDKASREQWLVTTACLLNDIHSQSHARSHAHARSCACIGLHVAHRDCCNWIHHIPGLSIQLVAYQCALSFHAAVAHAHMCSQSCACWLRHWGPGMRAMKAPCHENVQT